MGLYTYLGCTVLLDLTYLCYQPAGIQRILLSSVNQLGLIPG